MQRIELIKITAASAEYPSEYVEKIVDIFLDTIIDILRTQDRVELRTDFGSFVVREKGGEAAADGRTVTKVQRVVSFKATPTLKKELRQSDEDYLEELHKSGAFLQIECPKGSFPKDE